MGPNCSVSMCEWRQRDYLIHGSFPCGRPLRCSFANLTTTSTWTKISNLEPLCQTVSPRQYLLTERYWKTQRITSGIPSLLPFLGSRSPPSVHRTGILATFLYVKVIMRRTNFLLSSESYHRRPPVIRIRLRRSGLCQTFKARFTMVHCHLET